MPRFKTLSNNPAQLNKTCKATDICLQNKISHLGRLQILDSPELSDNLGSVSTKKSSLRNRYPMMENM